MRLTRLLIIHGLALIALPCADLQWVSAQVETGANDRVRTAQQYLTTLGYDPGMPNGIIGPRTEAAIRAFQEDYDLPVDGKVSDQLIGAIYAAWLVHLKSRLEVLEKPSGADSSAPVQQPPAPDQ